MTKKKTITDPGRFMSEFASPLINEAESRFGVSLNPRLRSKLGIKGKTTSSVAPTGVSAGVGKGVKKAAEMAKMAGAAKMMKSGGAVKRKRSIDGIAKRGKTRAK